MSRKAMITITEEAAKQMKMLASEKGLGENAGLRLRVGRGGCAGLQYEMSLDPAKDGDIVFSAHGVNLFVPPDSVGFLEGSVVDYEGGLSGAGFRIRNPNAARSCGCGTSFEPAA